jgi:hypothetical protein
MTTNTGGPAFPTGIVTDDKGMIVGGGFGMALRDYFAAKAMQGLLSNPKLANEILKNGGAQSGWIEDSAWAFADAMLKAR